MWQVLEELPHFIMDGKNCKIETVIKCLWELRNVFHQVSLTGVSEVEVQF